jgi:hypothetical protein
MGWFVILIGLFLLFSAFLLNKVIDNLKRRDLLETGYSPLDKLTSGKMQKLSVYLIGGTGVVIILTQAIRFTLK